MRSLILMKPNSVQIDSGFKSRLVHAVEVSLGGSIILGKNCNINNGSKYNKIVRLQKCFL